MPPSQRSQSAPPHSSALRAIELMTRRLPTRAAGWRSADLWPQRPDNRTRASTINWWAPLVLRALASAQCQAKSHWLPISVCPEINDRAGRHCGNGGAEIARNSEGRAVDCGDHVACFDSCVGSRAAGFGAVKNRSVRNRHTQTVSNGRGHRSSPCHAGGRRDRRPALYREQRKWRLSLRRR